MARSLAACFSKRVPSFVFDGRFVTSGAQEPPVLARMIDAALAADDAA